MIEWVSKTKTAQGVSHKVTMIFEHDDTKIWICHRPLEAGPASQIRCEVCGLPIIDCTCPECPECGIYGDTTCKINGGFGCDIQ